MVYTKHLHRICVFFALFVMAWPFGSWRFCHGEILQPNWGFLAGTMTQRRIPIGSTYGIFTYIWVIYGVNVGKYSIHGSYGIAQLRCMMFASRSRKSIGISDETSVPSDGRPPHGVVFLWLVRCFVWGLPKWLWDAPGWCGVVWKQGT